MAKRKSSKSNQDISPKLAEDRDRALKAALSKIEKEYGKGAVQNSEMLKQLILVLFRQDP